MEHELPVTDARTFRTDMGQVGRERFIASLVKLKSDIEHAESQLPSLGNELSSLCETAIEHLLMPDEGGMSMSPAPASLRATESEATQGMPSEPETERLKSTDQRVGVFNNEGGFVGKGLDRMGDGIIYVFEKLISIGSPKKKKTAEATPASMN